MSEETRHKNPWPLIALWLGLCGLGFSVLLRYQRTPGEAASAPEHWPAASALRAVSGRETLLLFVHPRCPCTRASVDSLAWIMARGSGRVAAYAVFYKPPAFAADWEAGDLWRSASAIPGVTAVEDADGREARRFGAETSGQALLFDAGGRLLYRGGLTGGRGHFGDNPGRDAVLALAKGRPAKTAASVFGCSLLRSPGHG